MRCVGEHIKTDFNKLKEAFKETYMSRSKYWMNVKTLEDRKLELGEKVENYIADIIKMTNKLGMKDEETRSYIIRGLTPKLKAELITHNPSTLSETIERVYLSEAALKLKNSEIQAIDTNSQIAAITTTIARLDRTINEWNKPRDKIIQNGIQPMNNNADDSTLSRYQRDDHNKGLNINSNIECFVCGKIGHIAKNCWHRQKNNQNQHMNYRTQKYPQYLNRGVRPQHNQRRPYTQQFLIQQPQQFQI